MSLSENIYNTDNRHGLRWANILGVHSLSATWMICDASFVTVKYEVVVDNDDYIQDWEQKGLFASDLTPFFSGAMTSSSLINQTSQVFMHPSGADAYWHNDTFCDSWIEYLWQALDQSARLISPSFPTPSSEIAALVIQDVFGRIFAITLGLNLDWLEPAAVDTTIEGTVLTPSWWAIVSQPAYIIRVVLLAFNVVMAICCYSNRPPRMLNDVPTTIARIAELFNGSSLIAEAQRDGGF